MHAPRGIGGFIGAMFVYLDESGDTGFKFRQGSSRYFVVALLLVDDPIPLLAAIVDLRERLGFAPANEFKFSNSREPVRQAFLRLMVHQECAIRALVIDKTLIPHAQARTREAFYSFVVRLVLSRDRGTIRNAMVILDESVKSKKSQQRLTTHLRQALNGDPAAPKIRGVRYHDSRSDSLIQAVDMVSGIIYAHYHHGEPEYLRLIRTKVVDIWEWQPHETH